MSTEGNNYNGWKNYETWLVALWLDNNRVSYEATRDDASAEYKRARYSRNVQKGICNRKQEATEHLAQRIRERVNECAPQVFGLYADLLFAALCEVDWYDIAGYYVSDLAELWHDEK